MAIVLPAVGTWPGVHPVGVLEPGQRHLETHVEALLKAEHYLCSYYGAQHFQQVWPEQLATGFSLIHSTAAPPPDDPDVVLEYLVRPRHHCTGLRFTWRADGGTDGGLMRITAVEAAVNVVVALPVGVTEGYSDLLAVGREDLLTTITVELQLDGTSADIDLWALGCYDLDMTQAELAAL